VFRSSSLRHSLLLPAIASAALLAACTTVDWSYERSRSSALAEPRKTSVGALFQEAADQHPGESGFSLVEQGEAAFLGRLAMADLSEKTLDAQYYIWDGDITGRILARHMIRAADRGVRVRLLLDDNYQSHTADIGAAALDAHPNIEIRFFNPAANRKRRMLSFMADFGRLNHRMHNKLLISDNALAIVGGRNIGDVYFGVGAHQNYRDLDVLAAGPIVHELSEAFDLFWNSEWAIPVGAVVNTLPTEQELRDRVTRLEKSIDAEGYPYPMYESVEKLRSRLVQFREDFIWAPGRVLVEHPSRVSSNSENVIGAALAQRAGETQHELLVESPYFVLGDRTIESVREHTSRGVRVRILTNSAASNDVMAAHAGYAPTRKKLLKAGAELYELRPDSDLTREWSVLAGKSRAALHAKALVFDRQSVCIGSFNLDPRSIVLNTEIGLMIDSPQLANQLAAWMDGGISPGSAYRVTLDARDDLMWTARDEEGQPVEYGSDPDVSLWRRFMIGAMRLLPDSQL